MSSRVAVGFNRLGIVLCAPFLMLALTLVVREIFQPTGPVVVHMPVGTLGWNPDRLNASDQTLVAQLIAQQKALGISSPDGFVVIGIPLGTENQSDGVWTKFQLRDGREIGIFSADKDKVSDTAINFLWTEGVQQRAYSDKDTLEFGGTRVKFLDPFAQFPPSELPWPRSKEKDWKWAVFAACFGLFLFVAVRAIGWVVAGFIAPARPT